jgi:hypothetical protein
LNYLCPKRTRKKQGRLASPKFAEDLLYALGAFRLSTRGGRTRPEIIKLLGDGKRYYSEQALTLPLNHIRRIIALWLRQAKDANEDPDGPPESQNK